MAAISTLVLFFATATLTFVASFESKVKVADSVPLVVHTEGKVAVPIRFVAQDYNGPYDPLDPKGIAAALHRQGKIDGARNVEKVKSYIPPGLDHFAKKEVMNLVAGEGKRFAFAHPKETAEILGIATRAKALYDTASHKLKAMEKGGHKFPW